MRTITSLKGQRRNSFKLILLGIASLLLASCVVPTEYAVTVPTVQTRTYITRPAYNTYVAPSCYPSRTYYRYDRYERYRTYNKCNRYVPPTWGRYCK